MLCSWVGLFAIAMASKAGRKSASVSSYETFRFNQLRWMRNSVVESSKNLFTVSPTRVFPSLAYVDDDVSNKISSIIHCLTHGLGHVSDCCEEMSRLSDHVIFHRDDQARKLYFGYSFVINYPPVSAEDYASLILFLAEKSWSPFAAVLKGLLHYEQIHIGYGSGGTLATLIARRFLIASRNYRNIFNHVKVVTIDEFPMYPRNSMLDFIGNQNHLIINSGGRGQEFNQKITSIHDLKDYTLPEVTDKWNIAAHLILRHSSLIIRGFGEVKEGTKDYLNIERVVKRQLLNAATIGKALPLQWDNLVTSISNSAHSSCAHQVELQVSRFLPHLAEMQLVCKATSQSSEEANQDIFRINCAFVSKGEHLRETHPVSSYVARMSMIDEYPKTCSALARATIPQKRWSHCLHGIVAQSEELSMISSYRSNNEPPNCKFFNTEKVDFSWSLAPRGCVVVPEARDDLLREINQHNPRLLLSMIPVHTEFPPLCKGLIKPLLLGQAEVAALKNSIKEVSEYLKEILGQAPESPAFYTREKYISNEPLLIKGEALIACLNGQPRIVNCKLETNRWITGTCPDFCRKTVPNTQNDFLCQSIVACPEQAAYIVISGAYVPQLRRSLLNYTKRLLEGSNSFNYALYSFRRTTLMGKLGMVSYTFVGILLDDPANVLDAPKDEPREGKKASFWW